MEELTTATETSAHFSRVIWIVGPKKAALTSQKDTKAEAENRKGERGSVAIIVIGILGGLVSVIASFLMGFGWLSALIAYPIGGSLIAGGAAVLLYYRPLARRNRLTHDAKSADGFSLSQ